MRANYSPAQPPVLRQQLQLCYIPTLLLQKGVHLGMACGLCFRSAQCLRGASSCHSFRHCHAAGSLAMPLSIRVCLSEENFLSAAWWCWYVQFMFRRIRSLLENSKIENVGKQFPIQKRKRSVNGRLGVWHHRCGVHGNNAANLGHAEA